jgi:hypothetical protein
LALVSTNWNQWLPDISTSVWLILPIGDRKFDGKFCEFVSGIVGRIYPTDNDDKVKEVVGFSRYCVKLATSIANGNSKPTKVHWGVGVA